MLKRVHVDNYTSLVDFDLRIAEPVTLLLGPNGSGKSAVLGALRKIRGFLRSLRPLEQLFPRSSLTRWRSQLEQVFVIEVEGNGGGYVFRLVVGHDPDRDVNRVKEESLEFDGSPLYRFRAGDVTLFRDDGSEGPTFPADTRFSGARGLYDRSETRKLTWFKGWFDRLVCVSIDPGAIDPRAESEDVDLYQTTANFASWYRHQSQEALDRATDLNEWLKGLWRGFQFMTLSKEGARTRVLRAQFDWPAPSTPESPSFALGFEELSHGQRSLVILYAILAFSARDGALICIDEPDNFVSLREIQPWLMELLDVCRTGAAQTILVSHHPELIDPLARPYGISLERDRTGATRARPFRETVHPDSPLGPSELVARGWDDAPAE